MEEFFYIGTQIDEVRLIDLILRRYHTLEALDVLPIEKALRLILTTIEDEVKERYRQEWLHLLPVMVMFQHYMTFDDYYNTCTGKNIDRRPVEEIMQDIQKAHASVKD